MPESDKPVFGHEKNRFQGAIDCIESNGPYRFLL
jgi:hypothetical protein